MMLKFLGKAFTIFCAILIIFAILGIFTPRLSKVPPTVDAKFEVRPQGDMQE